MWNESIRDSMICLEARSSSGCEGFVSCYSGLCLLLELLMMMQFGIPCLKIVVMCFALFILFLLDVPLLVMAVTALRGESSLSGSLLWTVIVRVACGCHLQIDL